MQVTADTPDESNCPLALELATATVNRLPQGLRDFTPDVGHGVMRLGSA